MSEQITIDLTVQVEKIAEQIVRAKPLGPWCIQVVGSSWRDVQGRLQKKLEKEIPKVLPSQWYEGCLPSKHLRSITKVVLPREKNNICLSSPIEVPLETFRWELPEGQAVVKIPAAACTLFAKSSDLTDEVIAQNAKVALIRLTEKMNLSQMRRRVAMHEYEFHNLSVTTILGAKAQPKDPEKLFRKRTPTLRSVASDLSRAKLDPVYSMDDRVAELAESFVGESPQSVLLVGPAGVGKSALVHRLVQIRDQVGLNDRRIWSTSGARIVSGMSGLGMWQQRCQKLIREAHQTHGILHLGSLFELMEAGKIGGQPGVASMIRQAVSRGKLHAIAECTPEQFAVIERDDPILLRAFSKMEVKEAGADTIKSILTQSAAERCARTERQLQRLLGSETRTPVRFLPQAIEELYRLHTRYATYSALPAQPLRLMQTMLESIDRPCEFGAEDVAKAFSAQTGLPEFLVNDAVPINFAAIEEQLTSHVIGQAEPAELIVNLLATLKARMIRPGRPFASLLFIGPTGVGKTEMAKALAKLLYSDTRRMIRIDMSEYANPWSAIKLIGRANDGDGALTSPIREQPFSVVLLDEFEKADPAVFDMLLQLLGEGRLTDSQGRLADFRNAVVIMTSNLGVESYKESAFGFGEIDSADWRAHFEREVQRFVRPELLGRIDRIVPFRPLPPDVVRKIAARETELLKNRAGLKYRDAKLEFTTAAIDLLSEVGYQPKYGARPLRRAIEQLVTIPLADKLGAASRDFRWKFVVDASQGKIVIDSQQLARSTRELKDSQVNSINAWQQLGRMGMLARTCAPLRDLENDIERMRRQNIVLEKTLKKAAGPQRIAALREQLMTGQAAVETGLKNVQRVLQVATEVAQRHKQLLMAWYANESIDWGKYGEHYQSLMNQLRDALQIVMQGRTSQSNLVTIMAVGRFPMQLEIIWRAYKQLVKENRWYATDYVLKPFNRELFLSSMLEKPAAPGKSAEPVVKPATRLRTEPGPDGDMQFVSDVYHYENDTQFLNELTQSLGFAMEIRGEGAGGWLENESGVFHFVDPRVSGAKRRVRVRVSAELNRLENFRMANNWLEPIVSADRDPRRTFVMSTQTIQDTFTDPNAADTYWTQGNAHEALARLIRLSHEQSLWRSIGYTSIPGSAQLEGDVVVVN